MTEAPWLVLQRAADALHATAEAATQGLWKWDDEAGAVSTMDADPVVANIDTPRAPCTGEDGEWIALLSPAVAPPLEFMLRTKAAEWLNYYGPGRSLLEQDWWYCRNAPEFKLALALLGEQEE